MATPTSDELLEESRCFDCGISDGAKRAVLIYLFSQIAEVDMTATELLEASRCLDCGIPDGAKMGVLIYLATQISGGGGGGTGGVTCGTSDPVAAPTNNCTVFYRTDIVRVLAWNGSVWTVQFSE